ncbi:hypothetical protein [Paenibacillus sp. RC67]|uniref:hypothetical protein n=1 Tax=Paenibacillus sp. RC67 TaxID=3039392 RepID=UPI0024AD354A|nr:hypothetical protein [Paenibacillus sp. RC67]
MGLEKNAITLQKCYIPLIPVLPLKALKPAIGQACSYPITEDPHVSKSLAVAYPIAYVQQQLFCGISRVSKADAIGLVSPPNDFGTSSLILQ